MPFDFSADWGCIAERFTSAWQYWPTGAVWPGRRDVASNVVAYVPLGFLVAGGHAGRADDTSRPNRPGCRAPPDLHRLPRVATFRVRVEPYPRAGRHSPGICVAAPVAVRIGQAPSRGCAEVLKNVHLSRSPHLCSRRRGQMDEGWLAHEPRHQGGRLGRPPWPRLCELLQVPIPDRAPTTTDLLAFAVGGAVGAWAHAIAPPPGDTPRAAPKHSKVVPWNPSGTTGTTRS
jgi:hypothetical protein